MRKRYHAAAPEAILVDGRVTIQRSVYAESGARLRRDWISWAPVSVSTVLCKRGRLHATREGQKTLCGEVLGGGWTAAPGTWCGTGVVRCQHCEKSLARVMGEPATRRR